MKVTVGLVGHGVTTSVFSGFVDGVAKYDEKFIADTVTIWLDHLDEKGKVTEDTKNMHEGNYMSVALALARKRFGVEVFPVDIEKPEWLPKKPAKRQANA